MERRAKLLTTASLDIDNFGDLLFLYVTERYLDNFHFTPAAPFGWDMSGILDYKIEPYGPLLDAEEYDAIWTMGGELGGDLETSFWASAPQEIRKIYERSSPAERAEILRESTGGAPIRCAYIPSPIMFPKNAGTITVLNSVGISNMLGSASYDMPPTLREENLSILRGTTLLSVRDPNSSALLKILGLEHSLAPDIVHTVSMIRQHEITDQSNVAIVQCSESILSKLGPAAVANKLVECKDIRGFAIHILMAGAFLGADSLEANKELAGHIKRLRSDTDVNVIEERDPLRLVDHIRGARVAIGTSLHLRIVASAYNIPRVTISDPDPKATIYARTWDPDMPYSTRLHELDDAIHVALKREDNTQMRENAERLTERAHDNAINLAQKVAKMIADDTEVKRLERITIRRNTDWRNSLSATVVGTH